MARTKPRINLTFREQLRIKEIEVLVWYFRFFTIKESLTKNLLGTSGDDYIVTYSLLSSLVTLGYPTKEELNIYSRVTNTPQPVISEIMRKSKKWLTNCTRAKVEGQVLLNTLNSSQIKKLEVLLNKYYEKYDFLKGVYTYKIDWSMQIEEDEEDEDNDSVNKELEATDTIETEDGGFN